MKSLTRVLIDGKMAPGANSPYYLHWKAAQELGYDNREDSDKLIAQALNTDLCHVDAPIEIHEYLKKVEGHEVASSYLSWFMKSRDMAQFEQIENYVASLRKSKYVDYPLSIHIETLALCNAACTFCQYPELTRKGDKLSDETINKIINSLKAMPEDLPFTITLYGVSEPFLDKRIFFHIELINKCLPQANVCINTNGSTLTDSVLTRLAGLKVHMMSVSVNDYRKEDYEKTMKLKFEKTIDVLQLLQRAKSDGKISFPVGLTRAGDGTIHDLLFIKWAQNNFPDLTYNFSPKFVWLQGGELTEAFLAPKVGCAHWFEVQVRSTGQVAFCCLDGHIAYERGNLHEENILDVYNKPEFRRLRTEVLNRRQVQQCRSCTSG